MDALRIMLTQNSANYKKEETTLNKMTYPLPPFSTIIGAIHNACNYKTYHPMDISIQGKYESMHKKAYTDYCFLNSTMDDRGILVKMRNNTLLSKAFDKVASSKKSQGNSFRKGISIDVIDDRLLKEYRDLKDLSEEILKFKNNKIKPLLDIIKKRKITLTKKKKNFNNNSSEALLISKRLIEIRELEKNIKQKLKKFEENQYRKPYSRFATLTTSLRHYEILNNLKLIIHIKSDRSTLMNIKNNIYNLKAIGRSEDFVEVKEVCFVELDNQVKDEIISKYSAYLDYDLVKNEIILLRQTGGAKANGTKYYLNKNYTIQDNKRVFEKKKVIYASRYAANIKGKNLFFDIKAGKPYIVNFL